MNIIEVKNLSKDYKYKVRNEEKGFLYNLFNEQEKVVKAVNNISFNVEEGETVAFIGPNGAGKSTTIKMLTGILYPTKGDIKICGLTPIKDRNKLAFKIGTVFGQRSQLLPNLPLTESMEMFGAMYDMDKVAIKKRINELSELFDLKEFIKQPVRKLSLGQRMRAEIATSLIHSPKIIFLDEPTIGLDVVSKKSLRDLLLKINKEEINEIDKGYSNKIKWWLVKFKGVASKYLDHYLNWRAFEYKNSIEYTRNNSIIEKINFNINVKAEINTYLSWNKIKEKVICI